jgi:hypothetical protein
MTLDSIQRLGVVEKIQMMFGSEASGKREKRRSERKFVHIVMEGKVEFVN